jgi:hypothetical protein
VFGVKRRDFITLLGGRGDVADCGWAQQHPSMGVSPTSSETRQPVIGFLYDMLAADMDCGAA